MRCRTVSILVIGLLLQAGSGTAETTFSRTDGYVMGAGRWTCGDILTIAQSGTPIQKGQLAGWIFGFWSSMTFVRETAFVDTVEQVGGRKIYDATLVECNKAPGSTLLHHVVRSMVQNTK